MQELGRHKPVSVGTTALQRYLLDRKAFARAEPGPAVQLISRDAFVSETAIKLDQVVHEIKSLGREMQLLKSDIAELRDDASRNYRFSEFMNREQKARAVKLDELSRRLDYLKTRFDAVDGNSKGDYQAFRSFEAIGRRLTELGQLEREFHDVSWKLKLSVGLFAASLVVWFLVLTTG